MNARINQLVGYLEVENEMLHRQVVYLSELVDSQWALIESLTEELNGTNKLIKENTEEAI